MSTVTERFFEVIDLTGETATSLSKKIPGITTKQKLSNARNGRNAIQIDVVAYLCSINDKVNPEYILTGKGSPLKGTSMITNTPTTKNDIKILDIRVCAGQGIGFDGDENKIIGYVNIPDFTGCYGITVYGDSMYDMYMSGDTIFVREIKDRSLIDNGQPYVIITQEDRLLKLVYMEESGLKLVSFNTVCNPDGRRKYPDMKIEGDQILYLYKVVGKLARNQM